MARSIGHELLPQPWLVRETLGRKRLKAMILGQISRYHIQIKICHRARKTCSHIGTQNLWLLLTGQMHYRRNYCPVAYLHHLIKTTYNLWQRPLSAGNVSTSNSISNIHSETGHVMLTLFHIWRQVTLCAKNVQTGCLLLTGWMPYWLSYRPVLHLLLFIVTKSEPWLL